jgi:GAF domain-containing protein/HAMP domain-containing protein
MHDPLTGKRSVFVARPVTGPQADVLGVLVGRADLHRLNLIMEARIDLRGTGETYVIDSRRRPLTYLAYPLDGDSVSSELAHVSTTARGSGRGEYDSYSNSPVIGVYRWIPVLEVALLAEQEQSEVAEGALGSVTLNAILLIVSALVAVGASVLAARGISRPLLALAQTATQIAAGDLTLEADVTRQDEIGALGQAFNSMTSQLRDLIGGLEARIEGATRNLEAAAEVSRATTSVLDPEALQRQVVDLIREQFGLYYVGLFLLDEADEYAVLRAGTGEFGRVMLERGHRLAVGGESMIGQSVERNELVVLQGSGDKVLRFDNPLLPDTRSELALPMRARGRVIGAMTVQSDQEAAFDEQYIATLQTVADQVGVAIDNARNFAEVEAALERAQLVQRRYLGQAWGEYMRRQPVGGYEYASGQGRADPSMRALPVGGELLPQVARTLQGTDSGAQGTERPDADGGMLVVPVVQGNQVIATLGFERAQGRGWGAQDVALAQAVAEQLGLAAETQRLLEATQSRAAREQLTLHIAEQVRDAVDVEEILSVASRSLGRELNAEVVVRLGTKDRLLRDGRGET